MDQSPEPKALYPADINEAGGVLLPVKLRELMNIEIDDDVAWIENETALRLINMADENE